MSLSGGEASRETVPLETEPGSTAPPEGAVVSIVTCVVLIASMFPAMSVERYSIVFVPSP